MGPFGGEVAWTYGATPLTVVSPSPELIMVDLCCTRKAQETGGNPLILDGEAENAFVTYRGRSLGEVDFWNRSELRSRSPRPFGFTFVKGFSVPTVFTPRFNRSSTICNDGTRCKC